MMHEDPSMFQEVPSHSLASENSDDRMDSITQVFASRFSRGLQTPRMGTSVNSRLTLVERSSQILDVEMPLSLAPLCHKG